MQIEVNEMAPCKLSIHYEADSEQIANKRDDVLNAFKKAPVPGFRKGKPTLDAIKFHYKKQIDDSLKRALAEEAYHSTLFEKKFRPHGSPQFNSLSLTNGKFSCDFELHTKPDFELAPYLDVELPKPSVAQNVAELTEEMMQNLRVRFGEAAPYSETDFVQTGDNVIVDYSGSIDGEKLDTLCATGEMLKVGASNLKQFDDNLLGMMIGETREFDLLVPEGALPSLAGKTAHMTATVNMGSKTTPCPLNDELAVKLGKKDFNELKEFVHASAGAAIQNKFDVAVAEAVSAHLVNTNTIDVPHWMSLSEAQYLAQQAKLNWVSLSNEDKEKYLQMSERNVKLSLVLDRIREDNPDAQLTDQEVLNVIRQNLSKTQSSVEEVIQQMNNSGYLSVLFGRIKDEHVMSVVIKSVKFVE